MFRKYNVNFVKERVCQERITKFIEWRVNPKLHFISNFDYANVGKRFDVDVVNT